MWCHGEYDVRFADIKCDVTLPFGLVLEQLGKRFGTVKSLAEDQPPPAAIHRYIHAIVLLKPSERITPAFEAGHRLTGDGRIIWALTLYVHHWLIL